MKKIILFLTIAACFIACKKKNEDVPAPLEPYSLQGYLQKTGYNQHVEPTIATSYIEMGLVFETLVAGSIKSFIINLPSVNTNLKIIVWDANTLRPIASSPVFNYGTVNADLVVQVTPIVLQKNGKYCISFIPNQQLNIRHRTDNAAATYPIVFSNLKILSFQGGPTTSPNLRTYPTFGFTDRYLGDLSFNFQ